MRRALLPLLVIAFAALVTGCPAKGVGDPCVPQQPPVGSDGVMCGDAGCFSGGEIYIETRSLQCRTRVCMVYKWDQHTMGGPSELSKRVFCTCRCDAPTGDQASFCHCPDDFKCTQTFVTGNPGIVGSYCVACEALPPGSCDAGTD